jgi:hypothetical protein
METYLTILSSNIFETINPFWAAVDKGLLRPSRIRVFYVPEYKKHFQKTIRWLQEIAAQYLKINNLTVEPHLFDDENIHEFISIVKEIIRAENKSRHKLVVDVTSAEWNYIPASLMLIAEENQKIFKSVLYHQFSSFEYSHTPYPLIPLTEHRLYNLLDIDALEDLTL